MNPRDNEREFGAMVRRGLASGPAAAESEHLDAEVLAAYFERTLAAEEIRACDLHVSNCAHCRSELAALARAEPEREGSGSRRFAWIWDWRFLAPVTAALALFIAWATVWGPIGSRNGRVATPIVAQNQAPAETAPLAPPPVPPSSEMVEVSPAPPSAATKDSKGGTVAHGKNVEAGSAPNGRPTDEESRADRREFKKERDRGASDTTGGASAAGVAAAAPAATSASGASNETLEVNAGEVAKNAAPATSAGASNAAAPAPHPTSTQSGTNLQKAPAAPAARAGGGSRGSAVVGSAGGIAAQKSAAPPEAETVTSRFKQDESTPIVIPTPDANILWRVAGAHEIELSRDIGVTWQPQLTETDERLVTGFAPSSKICWVVGRHGTILRTVDGENWQTVKSPTELDLTAVSAEDAEVATITAADGTAYVTKNGGAKWKRVKKPH